ncbi:MAG: DnaJ domain-containing protein, partial [Halobacteriales archaeon]|nr:DnaJ domain-containing protein [Halobacteriales archaeon]
MEERRFVDHYEVLQLNQNADAETVERVYRILAKRFHPDNASSGDENRFREVREAYEVLSDPERRAKFDVRYDEQRGLRWEIFEQET